MTTLTTAIIAAAHRKVLHDPLARAQRWQVRRLRRLTAFHLPLERDHVAAIEQQIARLEAEIYAPHAATSVRRTNWGEIGNRADPPATSY